MDVMVIGSRNQGLQIKIEIVLTSALIITMFIMQKKYSISRHGGVFVTR